MAKEKNEVRAITVAGVKGGCGKSTLSAALASTFSRFRLPDGTPLRAIWVWADHYGDNDMSSEIFDKIFSENGERKVRWIDDRGFYVCLRENLQKLGNTLSKNGTLHKHLFIFDTGAQLVDDAAKNFVPRSDLTLLPFNRSSAADGLAKMTDTLTYVARPDGETLDEAAYARVRTVLTAVPKDPRMRAAFMRKSDLTDFLSVPLIREKLLDEPMPISKGAQDAASLRQPIHAEVMSRTHDDTAPLAREVAAEAGWDDLTWTGDASAAEIRAHLRDEAGRIKEEMRLSEEADRIEREAAANDAKNEQEAQ